MTRSTLLATATVLLALIGSASAFAGDVRVDGPTSASRPARS